LHLYAFGRGETNSTTSAAFTIFFPHHLQDSGGDTIRRGQGRPKSVVFIVQLIVVVLSVVVADPHN